MKTLSVIFVSILIIFCNAKTVQEIKEDIKEILDFMYTNGDLQQSYFTTYVDDVTPYGNNDPGAIHFHTLDTKEKDFIISQDESGRKSYGEKDSNPNIQEAQPINDGIVPQSMTFKRPGKKKPSIEFITIHDTGDDQKNAADWNEAINTDNRPVSWHFTVDDVSVYQHVPLDEVARHAGDGQNHDFYLTNTGIDCDEQHSYSFSANTFDQHLYLNNIKTPVIIGLTDSGACFHNIVSVGIFYEIRDGKCWVGSVYSNMDYKVIANMGGNRNSIGIESCIKNDMRYSKVMRRFSNLVAHLLKYYNLGLNRVRQHRHFSGKECPMSMIRAQDRDTGNTYFKYDNFLKMIKFEYDIITKLPEDIQFNYTITGYEDIMDENGFFTKYLEKDTEVTFSVGANWNNGSDVFDPVSYTYTIHGFNPSKK